MAVPWGNIPLQLQTGWGVCPQRSTVGRSAAGAAVGVATIEAIPLVVLYIPMTSVCCTFCLNCSAGNPRASAIKELGSECNF